MIKFMKHYVTDGSIKARVHYSSHALANGTKCVTLYAKRFDDGRALASIVSDGHENNTDMCSDYFDKGLVRILEGSPFYSAALARCAS